MELPTPPVKNAPYPYSGSFTSAGSRKKRKNKLRLEAPSISTLFQRATDDLGVASTWLTECQRMLRGSLRDAMFISPDILCLGLGSPGSSRDARVQLAFLLSVCHELDIDRRKVSIYDPVFTDEDVKFLTDLHVNCLTENREARYFLANPTIVFMPHCDRHLYENILRENWAKEGLQRMLLVANCFSDYVENIASQKLAAESPCVSKITPYLQCTSLPTLQSCGTAFNNTAIQLIRRDELATLDDDPSFWGLPSRNGQQAEESSGAGL